MAERKSKPTTKKSKASSPGSSQSKAGDGLTLSISKRTLQVAGAALLVVVAVAGIWYFAIRDTGPSEAELEAQEQEEAQAAVAAAVAQCQTQVGGLIASLRDLESRLNGVGVNYEEYSRRVGDVSAAYGQTPINQLSSDCLLNVGVHAEGAMNAYIDAGNTWSECFEDLCDSDSIDPELQADWTKATSLIDKSESGYSAVGAP